VPPDHRVQTRQPPPQQQHRRVGINCMVECTALPLRRHAAPFQSDRSAPQHDEPPTPQLQLKHLRIQPPQPSSSQGRRGGGSNCKVMSMKGDEWRPVNCCIRSGASSEIHRPAPTERTSPGHRVPTRQPPPPQQHRGVGINCMAEHAMPPRRQGAGQEPPLQLAQCLNSPPWKALGR
jgi:hypothetical protein